MSDDSPLNPRATTMSTPSYAGTGTRRTAAGSNSCTKKKPSDRNKAPPKATKTNSPSYKTPEKGQRRSRGVAYEQQGMTPNVSPPSAADSSSSSCNKIEPKLVYLIRHGESLGQKASRSARQSDPALQDCGLSDVGIQQASKLGNSLSVDLVISSPLQRALQTSLTAFGPATPILCHYHLREIGSPIPENCPRRMAHVLEDLKRLNLDTSCLDYEKLQPPGWPDSSNDAPKVVRSRDHIPNIFKWIASHRPEQTIAVVCHYHVIRAALRLEDGSHDPALKPSNCEPISCHLCPRTGRLSMVDLADAGLDAEDNLIEWVDK